MTAAQPTHTYLTTAEAARRLGVSYATLLGWRRRGWIHAHRVVGLTGWRWLLHEVIDGLSARGREVRHAE